jgi:hypothetical protein
MSVWYALRPSPEADSGFVDVLSDLLGSTFRNLVVATGIGYSIATVLSMDSSPDSLSLTAPSLAVVLAACGLAHLARKRSPLSPTPTCGRMKPTNP